jgi:hypothetical protein
LQQQIGLKAQKREDVMKKINLLVATLVSLLFIFVVSACASSISKPGKETQLALVVKSLHKVILNKDSQRLIVDTPRGTFAIRTVQVLSQKFLADPAISEVVKRRDINGIEKKMLMVDVDADANVEYVASVYGVDNAFHRTEHVKYKMFISLNKSGEYLSENGVIEVFDVGNF